MNKRPETLFVFPNMDGNFIYHLGANYIITYLREKKIYSEQFVCDGYIGLTELTQTLLEKKPKIIGFSCFDYNYFLVKLISQHLKAKNPKVMIVAGGPTATFSDKRIMEDTPEIDLCVRGEGEYTVYEILQRLKSNRDFSNVAGISFRKDNEIIQAPDRPLIRDVENRDAELDLIPSPYLTGVLEPKDLLKKNGSISVLTARGCIYNCTYCNFAAMSRHTIRNHSIERVIAELKKISGLLSKEEKYSRIVFDDDAFTLNRERTKQVCQRIIEEKIDLGFSIDTRGDCVDQGLLELLFKAGVQEINFGLESAVPEILYNLKKVRARYTQKDGFEPEKRFLEKIRDNVKLAKRIGMETTVSIISGLPGETFEDGMKTVNFVKELKIDNYSHNILKIYPGTELFKSCQRHKLERSDQRFGKPLHYDPLISPFLYKYNPFKIPRLKNEEEVNYKSKQALSRLTNSLMGTYKATGPSRYPKDVILIGDSFRFGWLKKNTAFQTRFIYGKNIHLLLDQEETPPNNQVQLMVGVSSFHPKYENFYISELEEVVPEKFKKNFLYTKFSWFDESMLSELEEEMGILLGASTQADVDELQRQAILTEAGKGFSFYTKPHCNCFLLDGCRWLSSCPALHLHRLIVDANDNILPCFQGKVIGKVNDGIDQIQLNVAQLWDEERAKRDCDNCPAKDTCSKCPFIDFIGVDRYCEIKRDQPQIANFIISIQLARKIDYSYMRQYSERD